MDPIDRAIRGKALTLAVEHSREAANLRLQASTAYGEGKFAQARKLSLKAKKSQKKADELIAEAQIDMRLIELGARFGTDLVRVLQLADESAVTFG